MEKQPYFILKTENCIKDEKMKSNEHEKINRKTSKHLNVALYFASLVIVVLCAFSNMIVLHWNNQIMQQNLELLQMDVKFQEKCVKAFGFTENLESDINLRLLNPPFRPRQKRSSILQLQDCPPCPTEAPPNPVHPYRNPVSVLNENFPKKTNYTTAFTCEAPPVHEATLRIDDHNLAGKTWKGKGKTKQHSKQNAAWIAIQQDIKELIGEVADEYIPLPHNPACQRPPQPPS